MKKETVALLIKAKPYSEAWVKPENGKTFTLEELQGFVGGSIEMLHPRGTDQVLIVNEEGRLLELPLNEKASLIYHDYVVGDVLLTDKRLVR